MHDYFYLNQILIKLFTILLKLKLICHYENPEIQYYTS